MQLYSVVVSSFINYSIFDNKHSPTFLFYIQERDTIYLYGVENFHDRLVRLLLLVDFSKGVRFQGIGRNENAAVLEVIKLKNLQTDYRWTGFRNFLPQSEALNIQIT